MTTLLETKKLGKSYNQKDFALKDVNLQIQEGEFIVIIGPSGAGKSTFIRTINRMVDASEGEVIFEGVPMNKLKGGALRKQRSKIGMIFQHYNLIGRTNVIKNVLHGRLGHVSLFRSLFGLYSEEDKQEAVALLKKVGLEKQIYKRAKELSGGQMQRVGICRAMMQRPKLILADEPIASLDPNSASIVMDHLKTVVTEKGITCIVNLHQVDFAKKYATRIIGIHSGSVVFDGRPDELSEDVIQQIYLGKEHEMTLPKEKEFVIQGEISYAEI
ncbi:phosphonate ABC transporter ATP-binding protein [Enterococcus saccharolyticus]|uniref:Phosphonate ABC transporter ATP-binding protein n=1 Tax=Candidatus Enterococcus willemsii TaxID=1857215 RepID=A0ABQ6YZA3_9ENTE|nr:MULTISPECIES: phosphonate ABC transporter ATP-binding protein [Enterococcus]KAF1303066.1 phosphonate ABC transporter ATP-binding protein [Enterococcus sp. CU12B]MCD5001585.1 phosphonate ABC transporter ATP-binding protein [Enterococcus saccharolyticus]